MIYESIQTKTLKLKSNTHLSTAAPVWRALWAAGGSTGRQWVWCSCGCGRCEGPAPCACHRTRSQARPEPLPRTEVWTRAWTCWSVKGRTVGVFREKKKNKQTKLCDGDLTSSRLPPAWLDSECVRGRRGGNSERLVLTWRRARLQLLGSWKAQRLWKSNPQPEERERTDFI